MSDQTWRDTSKLCNSTPRSDWYWRNKEPGSWQQSWSWLVVTSDMTSIFDQPTLHKLYCQHQQLLFAWCVFAHFFMQWKRQIIKKYNGKWESKYHCQCQCHCNVLPSVHTWTRNEDRKFPGPMLCPSPWLWTAARHQYDNTKQDTAWSCG